MNDVSDALDAARCWALLREGSTGRVAAAVGGTVIIRPVNYVVDRGTVLIRTGHGSAIVSVSGGRVAFEADGVLTADRSSEPDAAWSVILEGDLRTVSATDELLDTFGVPLFPWHAAPKPVFLRLEPDTIAGREFVIADASTWDTPFGARRPGDID